MTFPSALRHALGLLALLPALSAAQDAAAPMPVSVVKYVPSSPIPDGFIRDVPGVLGAEERRQLNAHIATIQQHVHGDVGVAILPDIGDVEPYEVGTAIYRAWKIGTVAPIGNARRDVGALVLLVPKELASNHRGRCFITTGRGSEGAVVDAAAASICRDRVIPAMKTRAYAAAVDSAITGIEHLYLAGLDSVTPTPQLALARTSPMRLRRRDGATSGLGGAGMVALLVVLAVLALYGIVRGIGHWLRYRPRHCPKGHGAMRLLSEEEDDTGIDAGERFEEQIGSVNYDVWRCQAAGCPARLVIARRKWMSGYSDCPGCHRRALTSTTVTIATATTFSTGVEECTTTCAFCQATRTTRHVTPVLSSGSTSDAGSSSGGSSSGGSDFGGSGSSSGGGGGDSY